MTLSGAIFAILIVWTDLDAHELALAGGILVVLSLAWLGFGHRSLSPIASVDPTGRGAGPHRDATASPTPSGVIFLLLLLVALVALDALHPATALLQAFAYPYAWNWADRRRDAIAANVAIALAVTVGTLLGQGMGADGWASALTSAGLSLAFSFAMGLWVIHIARISEAEGRLRARLDEAKSALATAHREAGAAAERERFARELHDTLTQTLTGVVMLTERADTELRTDVDAARKTLALTEDMARRALAETRSLVARGRGPGVGQEGVGFHIRRLCARFSAETGIPVHVEASADSTHLTRDDEVVFLRCAQESLSNVRRHADAHSVEVRFVTDADGTTLSVSDDGKGFDADATDGAPRGFGLSGMAARLAQVGGFLRIDSSRGDGTTLVAFLPRRAVSSANAGGTIPSEGHA